MSLRWTILLLAAATAFAAEYKASDDGRVVYFTGAVADDLTPTRLWRWNDGDIQTLLDTPSLRLLRLTTDGRFASFSLSTAGRSFATAPAARLPKLAMPTWSP